MSRTVLPPAGGFGSSTLGPVINVTNPAYSGCFATVSTGQDWSTCFASVTAAAMAAAKVSVGVPTIRSVVATPMATSAITSATATVSIQAGDTALVAVTASSGSTLSFAITDPGGNTYAPANLLTQNGSGTQVLIYSTGVGIAKAASGTLTVTCNQGAQTFGFFVIDAFNVGSLGQRNIFNSATSTTPANTVPTTTATQDNNNIVLSVLEYCGGGATTLSANTGTLQASWNGTAIICGAGVVTNTSASPATLTTSATISASEPWVMSTIELRSVQITKPTIYFPIGTYNYSSGLSPTLPVTLKGEPGSILCYQGTAHAIDIGPAGLSTANFQGSAYYTVDSLGFQCGGSMTEGIFVNNWILFAEIKNSNFLNFGNQSASAIWAAGNQNDVFITGNNYIVNDGAQSASFPGSTGIPRQFVNATVASSATTLRYENNSAVCYSGVFGNVGCNSTFGTTPPLIATWGNSHIFTGNNFMGGFCPAIELLNGDQNTKIESNHFESDAVGCFSIAFQTGVFGLNVLNNFYIGDGAGLTPFIGPISGTDTLVSAEVSSNHIYRMGAAVPVVKLNNLAGQTANLAWGNMCSTALNALVPCPLIHTLGGNINQWNADYAPKLTFAASTTATYTFGTTYAVAPPCVIPPNIPGTATTLTITTLNTTTLTITASASNSATVFASCIPDAQ